MCLTLTSLLELLMYNGLGTIFLDSTLIAADSARNLDSLSIQRINSL